ncbi:hypothetical protein AgCh_017375 [Apium graveolens]
MILANHLIEDIVIENPINKLDCWVQEKRVIADLNRASHHNDVPLFYFPIMEGPQVSEVSTTVSTISTSQISFPLSVAMASVSMTQQMPTQATKTKISKSKTKKTPSGFSQKKPVAKSTKTKEGSVKRGKIGEGQDDLLAHLPILSGTVETSVPKLSSICTESTIVSTPNSIISSILVDIVHPSVSDCIPTDVPNSSHPSAILTTTPMDVPHPSVITTHTKISIIVTSVDELVVVQSLLGQREGSELSERLSCSQEKGEEKRKIMQAISSSLEKESERSSTLVGEGEGVRVVSQGEPLMQEKRENERKVGITKWEEPIVKEFFGDEDGDEEEVMDIGGELLQKLVAVQTSTSTRLVDNKKGEKDSIIPVSQGEQISEGENVINVQISQVIVPEITFPKPPVLDSFDLIQIAASKLDSQSNFKKLDVAAVEKELDDKWRKIDEELTRKFGPIEKLNKTFHHHSQVKQISMNEKSLGSLEKGQPSCIKSPKANLVLKPKKNYPRSSYKNPVDLMFETPRPDEKKLLARSIAFFKDPTDLVLKRRIAKIYRNGKEICVVAGQPQFAEAKKEEKERIKQKKKHVALDAKRLKQKKKQAAILAKLQAMKTTTEISEKPPVITEAQDQKMLNEPQQTKKPRYKQRIKRKLDFSDEELEDYIPNQSTFTTQISKLWTVLGVRDPVSTVIAIVKIRYAFTLSKEINESFKQSSQARTKLLSGVKMNVHVLTTGSEIKDLSKAIVLCRVPHHQNYSLIVELIFVGTTMMMFTVFDKLIGWFYKYGLDSWSGQIRGHIRPLRALDPVYRAKLGALLGIAAMADCFISISSDHSEPSVGGPSTDPRPAHPPVLSMPHPVAEIVPS